MQSSDALLHGIFLTRGLEMILGKKEQDGFPPAKEICFALAEMCFKCVHAENLQGPNWWIIGYALLLKTISQGWQGVKGHLRKRFP